MNEKGMKRGRGLVDIADGAYAVEKEKARRAGNPQSVTLELINKRFGLKKRQLQNYRANHYSRKRTIVKAQ